jgi:serine kinase of HPr protein (carbohydrate metabolism regulator)
MASNDDSLLKHATCIALGDRAALLRGPPGAGKSDLALRFISDFVRRGAALVADDQTLVRREGDRLRVSAPKATAGLIEVRGLGIVPLAARAQATLTLITDLVPAADIERLPPDPLPGEDIAGVSVPVLKLFPFEASAAVKLYVALGGEFVAET